MLSSLRPIHMPNAVTPTTLVARISTSSHCSGTLDDWAMSKGQCPSKCDDKCNGTKSAMRFSSATAAREKL